MACCTTPHIASRKSLITFMSATPRRAARRRRSPKYADDQRGLGVGVELVVRGQVAEVEVAVVHARVLPVEEPQPVAVGDEVGAQEVVVARATRFGRRAERGFDLGRACRGALVGRGDRRCRATAATSRCRCGTRKQSKVPASGPDSWKARSAAADRSQPLRRGELRARELGPGDEPRHEIALRFEERRDRRRDPERGRLFVGGALDVAVDVEQLGLVAGDPQHEALAVDLDDEVAVRGAAAELADDPGPARPPGTRATSAVTSGSVAPLPIP